MSTGLYRVYWKEFGGLKKWIFEAAFVYKTDALAWISSELSGMENEIPYRVMHNGKKVWSNV